VVPFVAGLLFLAWAVWAYHDQPPAASTVPFGDVGYSWSYASMFALGTMSTVGGPLLGLVVGRWLPFRGAGIISAVVLIMLTIVFQGIVEPLRYFREFMPWTYFGGPYGIEGEPERWLILTGSPFWYCLYLVALCAIGVIVAMLHDSEQPRQALFRVLVGVTVVAAVFCVLAMTTGVQEVMVNPLPGKA
jgi:formate hydrogenlyase subunit 3/multisubunit Na+/H+ antiporter MnhD subunit